MIDKIGEIFREAGLVGQLWIDEMTTRGQLVKLYREYYEGDHRMKLTPEMKKMMQISNDLLDRYNDNYCEMVVDSMADRLKIDTVQAKSDSDDIQAWADSILDDNRFDALQIMMHEATLRDGECFIMSEYDGDQNRTIWARELAWDGTTGILPVYDRMNEHLLAAAKVFYTGDDTLRVNIYFPDKTIRFSADEGGTLKLIEEEETTRRGDVPGVPLIAFKNRGRRSVLTNVVPLQDSLNSTLINLVMSSTLSAFSTLFGRGWKPPASISPGMVYHMMVEDGEGNPATSLNPDEAKAIADLNSSYDLKRIEGGEIAPLIAEAEWLIDQISTISSTPIPSKMGGDSQSGEALKQRDSRLVGKANRAQVQFGNAWEDLLKLTHKQQTLFAPRMPAQVNGWNSRWKSAEIRNDAEIRETAKLLHEWGYEREALRVLSQTSMVDYDEKQIDRLIQEKAQVAAQALGAAAGNLPGFDMFEPVV